MKKILLIEDEAVLQKAISQALEKENFKVFNSLDGELGLSSAEKIKPDLILLDLILPKMNGFEVLKRLKMNKETENIPVIVLTNLERTDDIERVIELGARAYLVKSDYSLDEIVEKIKSVLNNYAG